MSEVATLAEAAVLNDPPNEFPEATDKLDPPVMKPWTVNPPARALEPPIETAPCNTVPPFTVAVPVNMETTETPLAVQLLSTTDRAPPILKFERTDRDDPQATVAVTES